MGKSNEEINFKNGSVISFPQSNNDGAARGSTANEIFMLPELDQDDLVAHILDKLVLPKGVSETEMTAIIHTVLDEEINYLIEKGFVEEDEG